MNLSELASIAANEDKAFEMIERLRWPNGPVCSHCGATDRIYDLRKTRIGLRKCYHCRKQFTVRVGSIFEDSPIPLGKWVLAIHLGGHMTTKMRKPEAPDRPAPVSLHTLSVEQALGALLRTPNPGATKALPARKRNRGRSRPS